MNLDSLRNINGRYLISNESLWFSQILDTLAEDQKNLGVKIKTKILGNLTLKIGKFINPEISHIMPFLNQPLVLEGMPFEKDFGIHHRDIKVSLKEMAE